MFSPQDDESLEIWFQRLQAPLKRLPPEEQHRLHEEVRQHLEELAKAHEEAGKSPEQSWRLALDQFGDPDRFGRQMADEWRQSRTGFRADLAAILFGLGLYWVFGLVRGPLCAVWFQSLRDAHGVNASSFIFVVSLIIASSGMVLINAAVGLRYPLQALKGAFYSHLLWDLGRWTVTTLFLSLTLKSGSSPLPWSTMLTHPQFLFLIPVGAVTGLPIAYLASVTKRGWYLPALNDFKLTLPRRRRQIG